MTKPKAKAGSTTPATLAGARERPPTCFVDAHGGALAALAAGVARSIGHHGGDPHTPGPAGAPGPMAEALAATTSQAVALPPEVPAVLAEIGASAPPVVLASALPPGVARIDLDTWGLLLLDGQGDLERLAVARIARDRIERRLSANGSAAR
jgi:hypothetical protein